MPDFSWYRPWTWTAPPPPPPAAPPPRSPLVLMVDNSGELMTFAQAKAQLTRPTPGGAEIGSSGTPRSGNILGTEEYNRDLAGKNAIKSYDRMRRSDGQTKAVLQMLKLPLLGADWSIIPQEGGDQTDQEIANFCHAVIVDDDGMQDPWQFVLRHILLMLDFGFSVFEKVWDVGPDNKLVYWRLAPRLPQSIERWEVDDATGALVTVVQRAVKNGQEQELAIPAEDTAVFVHEQEGDNYNGISVLRPGYKHWFYKDKLYTIDAIGHERLSAGIPMAEADETADITEPMIDDVEKVLEGIRAHQRAYIIGMPGWKFKLLQTTASNESLMKSVEHHDVMIARSILAPFMNVGQAPNGTLSSTISLVDVFFNALQGVANEVASYAKRQLIKPLCDFNFPMEGRKYPSLVAKNIRKIDPLVLAQTLSQIIGAGVLTTDDGIENAFRLVMGYPPLDPRLSRENPEARRAALGAPDPNAVDPAEDGPRAGQPPKPAKPGMARGTPASIAASARAAHTYGDLRTREPNEFERRVMSFSEIPRRLDREIDSLVGQLADIRRLQIQEAARALVAIDRQSSADRPFSALNPRDFALKHGPEITTAIRKMQRAIVDYGAEQVRLELRRQGMPIALVEDSGAALLLDATVSGPSVKGGVITKRAVRDQLNASAKAMADQLNSQLRTTVMTEAVRLRRSGLVGDDLELAIEEVVSVSGGRNLLTPVRAEVHEAFGLGRVAEASQRQNEIAYCVQSALLDNATCGECNDVDGQTFAFGSDTQIAYQPPYVNCRGRDNCRCVQLYVYAGGGG
jgi:hypothetical protein